MLKKEVYNIKYKRRVASEGRELRESFGFFAKKKRKTKFDTTRGGSGARIKTATESAWFYPCSCSSCDNLRERCHRPGPGTFRPLSAWQKSDKSHYKNIKTPKPENVSETYTRERK